MAVRARSGHESEPAWFHPTFGFGLDLDWAAGAALIDSGVLIVTASPGPTNTETPSPITDR